jgi:hypothetical protein
MPVDEDTKDLNSLFNPSQLVTFVDELETITEIVPSGGHGVRRQQSLKKSPTKLARDK